jgi:hypothetical protein
MRIRLTAAPDGARITADAAGRTITGTLLPLGEEGRPSVGPERIVVDAGAALQFADPMILNLEHDQLRPLGRAVSVDVGSGAVTATFKISATTAGSDALTEAADGLRAGLSIEADDVVGEEVDGVFRITAARITEAGLVRRPAFTGAQITDVAAAAATTEKEGTTVPESVTAVAETVETVEASTPTPVPRVHTSQAPPTPGEWILAALSKDPARIQEMGRRVRAAAPHTFVADIPGLIPEAVVGPVVNLRDGSAPLFNALGPNTAPAGKSFTLPYIDPNLEAAAVATEKSDVTKQLGVKEVTVSLDFVKRAVNLSAEAVAYSQPSVIDVAVSELADAIALGCEKNVATKLEAVTGTNEAVELAIDGQDAWAGLAGGVSVQQLASGRRPDVFVMAPDVWAQLAGLTTSLGAPLIGGINQTLTGDWGTVFGLRVVVSTAITEGKAYLVSSYGVKTWTNASVSMRVDEPTILGYAIGAGKSVGLSVASAKFITPVAFAAAP